MTREERGFKIKSIYEKIGTNNIRISEGLWSRDTTYALMIGDVLDYLEKREICMCEKSNMKFNKLNTFILNLYKEKRKPIEEQSENLINYIYTLIN